MPGLMLPEPGGPWPQLSGPGGLMLATSSCVVLAFPSCPRPFSDLVTSFSVPIPPASGSSGPQLCIPYGGNAASPHRIWAVGLFSHCILFLCE